MIFTQTVSVHTNGFCDMIDLTPQVHTSVQNSGGERRADHAFLSRLHGSPHGH